MTNVMRALGLMCGTSMDGIDVALIETDGDGLVRSGAHASYPLGAADRSVLRQALHDAANLTDRSARPGVLAAAETLVTTRHAEAVEAFRAAQGLEARDIDAVGFHGQTVLHRPERGLTVQLGDGAALARRLGLAVVWDFRAADVAAGGQGAPFVPAYHRALVKAAEIEGPVVLVNIGGVANLTLVAGETEPLACDTGPGNALLDDLIFERTGAACDTGGSIAAAGQVNGPALAMLLAHPFFAAPGPKSLDRNSFSRAAVDGLSTADAAATLVAFTAASISLAIVQLPVRPLQVIICGGGGSNPAILRELARRLPCPVVLSDEYGWARDAMEAQAFAYLAVRSAKGWPLSFPKTTGVPLAMTGGVMSRF